MTSGVNIKRNFTVQIYLYNIVFNILVLLLIFYGNPCFHKNLVSSLFLVSVYFELCFSLNHLLIDFATFSV